MIHVAACGEMPFVSKVQRPRSARVKSLGQSPNKSSKLPQRTRASEGFRGQGFKRPRLSSVYADACADVKPRENRFHDVFLRLRRSLLLFRTEKPLFYHNSPGRSASTTQLQRKTSQTVRSGYSPQCGYSICEACCRKCATLEAILEEDVEDEVLSTDMEQIIQPKEIGDKTKVGEAWTDEKKQHAKSPHVKAVSTRHLLFSSAESAFQWQDEEGGTNRDPVKCQPIDRSPGFPLLVARLFWKFRASIAAIDGAPSFCHGTLRSDKAD
ncbi:hypothetical protein EGR_05927 [Echinococcus granulosus]|uniref:Uncharacterized protein n=1 Tax=Echinococcus granulosus TaxID=6210 RepID=W6UZV5_ECHGR|nr:hypothetical protein EGR_05927 [Echinococcus granulosus]EUB59199.1 hypothetical protein EGR_05927 [Echinococcus granulosus]